MVETILIKDFSFEEKRLLLSELGYSTDGIFVLLASGERLMDKYIEQPVKVDNMLILPGSTIIIDNNPLSIAAYMEEYPDVL